MNKSIIFIITVFCLIGTDTVLAGDDEYSVWIKVVDQNNDPIEQAFVYYCIFDCILFRNSHNQKQTVTNAQGYAQLKLKAKDSLRIQGVKKKGYDIRLQSMPFNNIKLNGPANSFKTFYRRGGHAGINLSFEDHMSAYSLPMSEPLITLTGWKLGTASCLEQDHKFIFHDGRAEQNWEINNKDYYFKIGDDNNPLREGNINSYDFKISINRRHYPWAGFINKLITTYEMVIEFKNGGAQEIDRTEYIHLVPNNGYKKKIRIKYTGIGDVSAYHSKKYFIKINNRFGALNLWLVPTRKVMFEYLLNRKIDDRNINIPSFIEKHGESTDYFTCASSAGVIKPISTKLGACAILGERKIGC